MATDEVGAVRSRFRWPIAVQRTLEVPADVVWTAISAPGYLESVHPFCAHNPVIRWPGDDAHDQVHYLNGLVMERRFRRWHDGIGYDLDIGERDGPTSHVTWRIAPLGGAQCSLKIIVYPHLLQGMPAPLRWLPYVTVVRPRLKSYLTSVIRGVEWHVTTGSPVRRKQWGSHPWFS